MFYGINSTKKSIPKNTFLILAVAFSFIRECIKSS
jgi:hypothetical protein